MKKIWATTLFFCSYLYPSNELEKAILESHLLEAKVALQSYIAEKGSFTDRQLIKYSDLAQNVINKRRDTVYLNKIRPETTSPYSWIGGGGVILSCIFIYITMSNSSMPYDKKNKIISSLLGTTLISLGLVAIGEIDHSETQEKIKQQYEDALHIKQLIYEAASV